MYTFYTLLIPDLCEQNIKDLIMGPIIRGSIEFSLNTFTESTEVSDKKI